MWLHPSSPIVFVFGAAAVVVVVVVVLGTLARLSHEVSPALDTHSWSHHLGHVDLTHAFSAWILCERV